MARSPGVSIAPAKNPVAALTTQWSVTDWCRCGIIKHTKSSEQLIAIQDANKESSVVNIDIAVRIHPLIC